MNKKLPSLPQIVNINQNENQKVGQQETKLRKFPSVQQVHIRKGGKSVPIIKTQTDALTAQLAEAEKEMKFFRGAYKTNKRRKVPSAWDKDDINNARI